MQTVADAGTGTPDLPDEPATVGGVLTQVIDPRGTLVAPEPAGRTPPLLPPAAARRHRSPVTVSYRGQPWRVLAVPVTRADGGWLVLAGEPLATQQQAARRVRAELVVAGAAVVALGTAGAWLLAGAALRPVERMRRSVSELRDADDGNPPDRAYGVREPRTRDELAALARTFNDLLGRLRAALVRQRQFTADASHELRGPLAVLRAELELADRPGRDRDDLAAAVRQAAAETDRLARLADDLLLLARGDDGALVVRAEDQPLGPVLAAAVAGRRGQAERAGVRLVVSAPGDPRGPVDADRLRHALDNLLDNALRWTPSGGTVTLRAGDGGGTVSITVADTGPGFPLAFLPHVFERFRRPDPARSEDHGGAGLGLSIVAAIAQAHGGSATAGNTHPHGAIVRIHLGPPGQPG